MRTPAQSNPLKAAPHDVRTLAALDESARLGVDLSDPFAPGWHEWDFGPEARDTFPLWGEVQTNG